MRVPATLVALSLLAAAPPGPEAPAAGERWLFNAGERTRAGLGAWGEGGDPEAARAPFEQALRLAPAAVETRFNAGTARLAAGGEGAAGLLEGAAHEAPPALAPRAWYNLGNARLAARDAAGAVSAYVESLRRDPTSLDAKHNLELALRELARQQAAQQPGAGEPPPGEERENPQGGSAPPRDAEGDAQPPAPEGAAGAEEFEPQPEMTRDQAQALLEAVESLEREQRQRAAEQRAAARAKVEIDW